MPNNAQVKTTIDKYSEPEKTPAWIALQHHKKSMDDFCIADSFQTDNNRFQSFSLQNDSFLLDYSKNKITHETISLLMDLARTANLQEWKNKLFNGGIVNTTENRPALHTALRGNAPNVEINGENIADFCDALRDKIKTLSHKIHADKSITDIVNIGVGGSNLAPRLIYDALNSHGATTHGATPRVHFVSNMDADDIEETLRKLPSADSTLFIISSKSFSTAETIMNAKTARDWFLKNSQKKKIQQHFIAVTAATDEAENFGITAENILPMRDWIGGRFSLWSGIGLCIAMAYGYEAFEDLLRGAHHMDEHFRAAPFEKNMPVILAMLGIWYRNFWHYGSHAILPYAHNLFGLSRYVQQLDMESNGKTYDRNGRRTPYHTSPVIFGEPGTNGQHAFFQLLHQGKDIIPADFITVINKDHTHDLHHKKLLANMLAQSEALMNGQESPKSPHKHFEGNRPSTCLLINTLNAYSVGKLLALYEHKIFVQGVVWNINSFDQWGVELGKTIALKIENAMNNKTHEDNGSTNGLIDYIHTHQNK